MSRFKKLLSQSTLFLALFALFVIYGVPTYLLTQDVREHVETQKELLYLEIDYLQLQQEKLELQRQIHLLKETIKHDSEHTRNPLD